MSKVLIIFGSKSDESVYRPIASILKQNKIEAELRISSAHRTPEELYEILKANYDVVIAGAGLSAALPGVIASKIIKPVIGVPVAGNYQGLDALLSIMQMPPGIPVLAVGVGLGKVAALNAVKLLKDYSLVNLIGGENNKVVKRAIDILKEFNINYQVSDNVENDAVNIDFTPLGEPFAERGALVIFCPLVEKDDDKAEAALNVLKESTHGLWVGLNRGDNAALAAVEIMNKNGKYSAALQAYRQEMKEQVRKSDKEVRE